MSGRTLKLGAVLIGVGGPGQHDTWLNPEIPGDASVDIQLVHRQRPAGRGRQVRPRLHRRQPVHHPGLAAPLPQPARAADAAVRASPCTPATSAWSARSPPRTTSRSTSPGGSPRSTSSAAAGPAGTSSPPATPARPATTASTSTTTTPPATAGRSSTSRWRRGSGTPTRTTRSRATRSAASSSTATQPARSSTTAASTSRSSARSTSSARRRASRSSSRPATPRRAATSAPAIAEAHLHASRRASSRRWRSATEHAGRGPPPRAATPTTCSSCPASPWSIADTDEEAREKEQAILGAQGLRPRAGRARPAVRLARLLASTTSTRRSPTCRTTSAEQQLPHPGERDQEARQGATATPCARWSSTSSSARRSPFVGSPLTVANEIQRWFEAGGFDGINLGVTVAQRVRPLHRRGAADPARARRGPQRVRVDHAARQPRPAGPGEPAHGGPSGCGCRGLVRGRRRAGVRTLTR